MTRRIITRSLQSSGSEGKADQYFDRIIKYIPADVVGAWVAISGIIPKDAASDPNNKVVVWIAFAVCLICCAAWTALQTRNGKSPAIIQIMVSTCAFAVWVAALGRPFDSIPGYQQYYGSISLVAFTLISGRIVPKD